MSGDMSGNKRTSCFARPHRYPKSIYIGTRAPSLQVQMGMESGEQKLRFIAGVIRQTCRKYHVDLYLRYQEQDINQLLAIRDEVIKEIPELRQYEEGWPVLFYLKVTLHDHGGHTPRNGLNGKKRVLKENCPLSPESLAQKRQRQCKPFRVPTIAPGLLNSAGHGVSLRSREILKTPQASGLLCDATSGAANDEDVIIISDSEESSVTKSTRTSTAASSQPHCSSQGTPCGFSASSSSSSPPQYATKAPRSIMDTLVSGGIPRKDAPHLTRLLASFGIASSEYLGALARMHSRDVWLLELLGQKKVSEIQMRILRDILEGLAAGH
ncbi:hypothetical protein OH76DRAFT_1481978 [Lentinus brumalis]|uniref:Uncharacterized protein n=1 Tax=Lentinus brumalis TaxID=2498619 RepID=A0A371DEI3_9APHY|nr:hypothetical protein OH76DRAFT_1481978 [Polyporus brumalis]